MKITELRNVTLGLKFEPARGGVIPHWELSFTERESGDITWVGLTEDVAAQVKDKLSSGVVTVAKPKLVVPRG